MNSDQVQNLSFFMADREENVDADIWYVDSGVSTHMTGNKHWMEDFKEINEGAQIYLGDDRSHQIKRCGKFFVILPDGNIKQIYNQNIKLQCDDGSKAADATLYRQLVGGLIYLTTTRPDLAYADNMLSQFMSKPLESHWNAKKNVLRYLQGTVDYGIIYTDSFDVRLAGFANSDWVGNVDDHRSITGYGFSLRSGAITWSSKKQNTVSLSSIEGEYQAMCAAMCEAVWLQRLLQDVGEEQTIATTIICDNQNSIKLANNPVFHKNTKHIDTQFHFVREKVQSKEIHLEYCNTCDNVVDTFIKPLGKVKFQMFREMLGIYENTFSIKGEC
eukprot:PITA_17652